MLAGAKAGKVKTRHQHRVLPIFVGTRLSISCSFGHMHWKAQGWIFQGVTPKIIEGCPGSTGSGFPHHPQAAWEHQPAPVAAQYTSLSPQWHWLHSQWHHIHPDCNSPLIPCTGNDFGLQTLRVGGTLEPPTSMRINPGCRSKLQARAFVAESTRSAGTARPLPSNPWPAFHLPVIPGQH